MRMKVQVTLASALELAIDRVLGMDPDAVDRLATLDGKVIGLEISGLELVFYLLPGPGGIHVLSQYQGEVDTYLRAGPITLAQLGVGADSEDRVFAGDVEIKGDTELGQKIRELLAAVDIDWEEQLSHAVGDVAAHQIGNAVRGLFRGTSRTLDTLGRDLAEYLQYEHRDLPDRYEVENFLGAVDTLRCDSDRLEARLKRLVSTLQNRAK